MREGDFPADNLKRGLVFAKAGDLLVLQVLFLLVLWLVSKGLHVQDNHPCRILPVASLLSKALHYADFVGGYKLRKNLRFERLPYGYPTRRRNKKANLKFSIRLALTQAFKVAQSPPDTRATGWLTALGAKLLKDRHLWLRLRRGFVVFAWAPTASFRTLLRS